MPEYVYEDISATEISGEVSEEKTVNPIAANFNIRDAVIAQIILERKEY